MEIIEAAQTKIAMDIYDGPGYEEGYDCVDRVFTKIASHYGRSHIMMLSECWEFKFNIKDVEKGVFDLRSSCFFERRDQLFHEYCGIKPIYSDPISFEGAIEQITENIRNNQALGAWVDCFWLP